MRSEKVRDGLSGSWMLRILITGQLPCFIEYECIKARFQVVHYVELILVCDEYLPTFYMPHR
jgi:hypothetical protein